MFTFIWKVPLLNTGSMNIKWMAVFEKSGNLWSIGNWPCAPFGSWVLDLSSFLIWTLPRKSFWQLLLGCMCVNQTTSYVCPTTCRLALVFVISCSFCLNFWVIFGSNLGSWQLVIKISNLSWSLTIPQMIPFLVVIGLRRRWLWWWWRWWYWWQQWWNHFMIWVNLPLASHNFDC